MQLLPIIFGSTLVFLVGMHRLRNGLILFLFMYSAYPRLLATGVTGEGFALSLQFASAVALILCWVARLSIGDRSVWRGVSDFFSSRSIALLAILFVGVKVVSTLINTPLGAENLSAIVNDLISSLLVMIIAVCCIRNLRDVMMVLTALVLSLFVNQMLAIIEVIKGASLFEAINDLDYKIAVAKDVLSGTYRADAYRVRGAFSNTLLFSYFVLMIMPFALHVYQYGRQHLYRLVALASLVLVLPTMLWSKSRGGLLMLLFVTGFFVAKGVLKKMRLNRALRRTVLIGSFVGGLLLFGTIYGAVNQVLLKDYNPAKANMSLEVRMEQVQEYPNLLEGHWLLGYGQQRNIITVLGLRNLDNFYLKTALESGVVGLLLLLLFLGAVFRHARRLYRSAPDKQMKLLLERLLVFYAIMFVCMIAMMQPYHYTVLYTMVGVAIAIQRRVLPQQTPPPVTMSKPPPMPAVYAEV